MRVDHERRAVPRPRSHGLRDEVAHALVADPHPGGEPLRVAAAVEQQRLRSHRVVVVAAEVLDRVLSGCKGRVYPDRERHMADDRYAMLGRRVEQRSIDLPRQFVVHLDLVVAVPYEARDQIEEFRRTEANMTSKERRQFKSAIGRTENEIKQLGLNAAEKMYGNKREDAKTIFTADTQERISDKENKTRLEAARIGATICNLPSLRVGKL